MTHVGWAADGYPVYAIHAYAKSEDPKSALKPMKSSYRLKTADRGGDGKETPTGKPARGSAERQDKGHSRKSAKNLAEQVKKPMEENTSSGDSNPRVELRPDGNTKTPNRDHKT